MSTLNVSNINNAAASSGGLSIDSDGAISVSSLEVTSGISGALPTPNRNLLYNGAMQVAQRGTSTAGITTSGYYTADRWASEVITLGTWTQSVESDGPTGTGVTKSLKMLCTAANSSPAASANLNIVQKMEGQDVQRIAKGTSSAQQLTLSFWVKSNVTGTYTVLVYENTNNRSISASYTISTSATWERKTITLPADTVGTITNNNGSQLEVFFCLAAGSNYTSGTLGTSWGTYTAANRAVGQTNLAAATNNYWQVTGVQLEVGPVATGFEFKSFAQELRECERYFEKSFPYNVAPDHNTGGFPMIPNMGSLGCGGNSYSTIMFRTQKRIDNGTIRWYDPLAAHTKTENWARTISNCTSGTAYQTAGSFTAYQSNISGYFQIGTGTTTIAEWTCEAEL